MTNFEFLITIIFGLIMKAIEIVMPIVSVVCFFIGLYNDIWQLVLGFGIILIVYVIVGYNKLTKPRQ